MEQTEGQKRIRVSFNPSGNDAVAQLKLSYALVLEDILRNQARANSGEEKRLWALAATELESSAMWAVKALTTPV